MRGRGYVDLLVIVAEWAHGTCIQRQITELNRTELREASHQSQEQSDPLGVFYPNTLRQPTKYLELRQRVFEHRGRKTETQWNRIFAAHEVRAKIVSSL